jgi:hypothetical protein
VQRTDTGASRNRATSAGRDALVALCGSLCAGADVVAQDYRHIEHTQRHIEDAAVAEAEALSWHQICTCSITWYKGAAAGNHLLKLLYDETWERGIPIAGRSASCVVIK